MKFEMAKGSSKFHKEVKSWLVLFESMERMVAYIILFYFFCNGIESTLMWYIFALQYIPSIFFFCSVCNRLVIILISDLKEEEEVSTLIDFWEQVTFYHGRTLVTYFLFRFLFSIKGQKISKAMFLIWPILDPYDRIKQMMA